MSISNAKNPSSDPEGLYPSANVEIPAMYQSISPLAAGLHKTGAVLVLLLVWLLLAWILPPQVSAKEGCTWVKDDSYNPSIGYWDCPNSEHGHTLIPLPLGPTPEPTQPPATPEPPTPEPPTPEPPTDQGCVPQAGETCPGGESESGDSDLPPSDPPEQPQQPTQPLTPRILSNAPTVFSVPDSPAAYPEDENRNPGGAGDGISSRSKDTESTARRPESSQQTYTCRWLPANVLVVSYNAGVQCQLLSGAQVGVQAIHDAAPLAAVDVWGPLGVKADVCFAGRGKMVFLNALFAPRRQEALSAFSPHEGVTCAYLDAPGTVVLLPGAPVPVAAETGDEAPTTEPKRLSNLVFLIEDPLESARPLGNCRIIARQNIHVRMEPAGERTGLIVADRNLSALARTDNWFMVALDGEERWVSAHFVNKIGQCQPQAEGLASGDSGESIEEMRAKPGRLSNLVFLINDKAESALPLESCQVSARKNIHVRMEPAGQRSGLIAAGSPALTVLARTENWFKVLLDGEERWVSAHFVNMTGNCQLQRVYLL